MLESIMLGEIPGTTIQISFYGWLILVTILLVIVPVAILSRNHIPILRADYFGRKALKLLSQYHLL
jgi:hypothetical protein